MTWIDNESSEVSVGNRAIALNSLDGTNHVVWAYKYTYLDDGEPNNTNLLSTASNQRKGKHSQLARCFYVDGCTQETLFHSTRACIRAGKHGNMSPKAPSDDQHNHRSIKKSTNSQAILVDAFFSPIIFYLQFCQLGCTFFMYISKNEKKMDFFNFSIT